MLMFCKGRTIPRGELPPIGTDESGPDNPKTDSSTPPEVESVEAVALSDKPVFVDFETRSPVNLSTVGGRKYAGDEGTEVICAVA